MKSLGVRQGYRLATTVQGPANIHSICQRVAGGCQSPLLFVLQLAPSRRGLSPDGDRSAAAPTATRSHAS
jgi:hypothetical protein